MDQVPFLTALCSGDRKGTASAVSPSTQCFLIVMAFGPLYFLYLVFILLFINISSLFLALACFCAFSFYFSYLDYQP